MSDKLWSNLQLGAYDNATEYSPGDFVNYLGSSYTCIATTTGNLPTDTDFWALVASKGDTGDTGSQGETGTIEPLSISEKTDDYTLVLTDVYKIIDMNKATANTLTVPLNSSVAFPIGSRVFVRQKGAGETTIEATAGVTINYPSELILTLNEQHSLVGLVKMATNTWVAVGDFRPV